MYVCKNSERVWIEIFTVELEEKQNKLQTVLLLLLGAHIAVFNTLQAYLKDALGFGY